MTDGAVITVVITTFNHEEYIEQAIESVLAQRTTFAVDVIVIDDCSTDSTGALLDGLSARHPGRFEIRRPPSNRNDHHDFGQALDECTSPYVAMLDGDDYWIAPDKLQRQVELLEAHPEFVLCCHAVEPVTPSGAPADVQYDRRRARYSRDELWASCFIHTGSTVFRRSGYDRLPDWYYDSIAGDWELFLLLTVRGDVRYLDEKMSAYRIHPGGTWSGLDHARQARQIHDFYRHQERAWGDGFRKNRAARLSQSVTLAYRYGEAGASLAAWRWLVAAAARSVRQRPGDPGPTRSEVKRLIGWRLRSDAARVFRRRPIGGGGESAPSVGR